VETNVIFSAGRSRFPELAVMAARWAAVNLILPGVAAGCWSIFDGSSVGADSEVQAVITSINNVAIRKSFSLISWKEIYAARIMFRKFVGSMG
jgi:hypothetical protein